MPVLRARNARRRVLLVTAAAVLGVGTAGATAYASSPDAEPIETGYAVVGAPGDPASAPWAAAPGSSAQPWGQDCPEWRDRADDAPSPSGTAGTGAEAGL